MLSYRHAYHAGNHADVFKHIALVMLLERMNAKEKPYTVFDTHAGAGRYDLNDARATKTNDAATGIKKLVAFIDGETRDARQNATTAINNFDDAHGVANLLINNLNVAHEINNFNATQNLAQSTAQSDANVCLSHYLDFVRAYMNRGLYPGSPEIGRAFMRPADSLILCELHNTEIDILRGNMRLPLLAKSARQRHAQNVQTAQTESPRKIAQTAQAENSQEVTQTRRKRFSVKAQIYHRDGFEMLATLCPPLIKRGFVFCDPSYEDEAEYAMAASALCKTLRRWPVATLALWYPLLTHRKIECGAMRQKITAEAKASGKSVIDAQLLIDDEDSHGTAARTNIKSGAHIPTRLYGSGMLFVNAPWKLYEMLKAALPFLANVLGTNGRGSWSLV